VRTSETYVHPKAAEKRRAPRKIVLSGAVVADSNGQNPCACTIRDISKFGAQISLPKQLPVGGEIYLVDASNRVAHSAKVAWSDSDRTGLAFVRTYALDQALPPQLRFVKKLLADAKLRKVERRSMPRTSVMWSGVISSSNGQNASDCTIRNINEAGAEISAKRTLELGEEVYLLVMRSQIAFLASVVWMQSERIGLSFSGTYEVVPGLPSELKFLRCVLVETRVRQMLGLVQRGVPLEEAARVVGWQENEIEELADIIPSADENFSLTLAQAKRLSATSQSGS
jgi:hypothetical protein